MGGRPWAVLVLELINKFSMWMDGRWVGLGCSGTKIRESRRLNYQSSSQGWRPRMHDLDGKLLAGGAAQVLSRYLSLNPRAGQGRAGRGYGGNKSVAAMPSFHDHLLHQSAS